MSEQDERLTTRRVRYDAAGVDAEGYLAAPRGAGSKQHGPRPALLLVHMWMGLVPFVEERARRLAELGYVAFALDLFGRGVRPEGREEAAALMKTFRDDPALTRARARAGLETLRAQPECEGARAAVMGWCFGGYVALELARAGAELAAALSFHGFLDSKEPAERGAVKAKLLAFHGILDPMVPREQILGFSEEMQRAGADWQLVVYGNAGHSFTNPGAGDDVDSGLFYEERADERSWSLMRAHLAETLGAPEPPR